MTIIKKPWGHEKILAQTEDYVVKELHVNPHSRLSLQYHRMKVETMFLVSGEGLLDMVHVDNNLLPHYSSQSMVIMKPYYIPVGMTHRLYTKDKPCLVVEISTTELDDVVRLFDDYDRA